MSFAPVVLYYYHCIIFTYTNISGNLWFYLSRIPYQILNKWIDIYRRVLGYCLHSSPIRDNSVITLEFHFLATREGHGPGLSATPWPFRITLPWPTIHIVDASLKPYQGKTLWDKNLWWRKRVHHTCTLWDCHNCLVKTLLRKTQWEKP